jgi:hypothetical protein
MQAISINFENVEELQRIGIAAGKLTDAAPKVSLHDPERHRVIVLELEWDGGVSVTDVKL